MSYVFILLSIGFFVLGCVFLGIGFGIQQIYRSKENKCCFVTKALVSEYNKEVALSTGDTSERLWYPVFAYTAKGQHYRVRSRIGNRKQIFTKGQTVTLYYDPEHPMDYYVPEENPQHVCRIFMTIGIVFIVLGATGWLINLFLRPDYII